MANTEEIQRRVDEARADFLGRRVREVWVEWASRQPNPKPSHLTPWDQLDEGNREVDRLIGTALAAEGYREANNAITWDTTCLNDAVLLDACNYADMRRERAEEAVKDLLAVCNDLIALYWVPKEQRAGRMPLADQHRQRAERARLVLGRGED